MSVRLSQLSNWYFTEDCNNVILPLRDNNNTASLLILFRQRWHLQSNISYGSILSFQILFFRKRLSFLENEHDINNVLRFRMFTLQTVSLPNTISI